MEPISFTSVHTSSNKQYKNVRTIYTHGIRCNFIMMLIHGTFDWKENLREWHSVLYIFYK